MDGDKPITLARSAEAPDARPGAVPVPPAAGYGGEAAARIAASRPKRIVDIALAAAALLVLAPVMLAIALAIMAETPGAPVFSQRRTGLRGVPFVIHKFRTMRVTEDGADVVQAEPADGRITRVGRWLRRTSIDELPQLINVLVGSMSLVGPRPHALVHDEYYGARIERYKDRFVAKPGITGLAQVSGYRGSTPDLQSMANRVEKDLEYIRKWSLLLDLKILFQTLVVVFIRPSGY
jgi:lipopolysaccharide/colanic/teichoic acid biosynthesis glycosyltransferase